MKVKNLILGTMFAGLAASASAQTTEITITGATAFRQATMQAIYDAYASMGAAGTSFNVAHDFSNNALSQLIASNKAIFKGTFPGITGDTVIRTAFNGSTEGLNAIAGNSNPTFLTEAALTGGNFTAGIKGATSSPTQALRPKFSFSDVYQSTSPVTTDNTGAPITLNPSGSSAVGIVTFAMIANDGAPASLTNVTTQQARALWTNGAQPLSLFTGDPSDTKRVYATGRNDGSGTRSAYLTEWTFGVANLVKQYVATSGTGVSAATPSGVGNGTINRLTLVPANGIGGGNVTVNGAVNSGSTTIVLNALPTYNDTTITTGNIISGTGLGANTTISALTGNSSAYTLTLSSPTTAQISNGATLLVNGIGNFTTDRTADASTLWGQTNAGNGGYGSSSALRTLMGYTSSNVTIYNGVSQNTSVNNRDIVLLTWLSTADCRDAAFEGAKILSFNGVGVTPLSKVQAAIVNDPNTPENEKVNYLDSGFNEADFKKIASGAYSAWSYQHLYYWGEIQGNELTWYNAMKNTWINQGLQKTANGLRSSDVTVDRADDGLAIFAPL